MTPLTDPALNALLEELHRRARDNDPPVMERVVQAARRRNVNSDIEVADILADAYMPISAATSGLLHLLAATRRPGRIVEFGTSMGISTICLAAALEPGDDPVITTEMEAAKADAAQQNLAAAGLEEFVEIREGDAFDTLADLNEPISMVFLDGWKGLYLPMLRLLEPLLVDGSIIVADDTTLLPDLCTPFLDYVRDPASPYLSTELPIDDGLELCVHRVR